MKESLSQWLADENNRRKYNQAWNSEQQAGAYKAPKVEMNLRSEQLQPDDLRIQRTVYPPETPEALKAYDDYVEIQKEKTVRQR